MGFSVITVTKTNNDPRFPLRQLGFLPIREDTNDAPRMQLVIVRYETLLMISHGFQLLDVDAIAFVAALTIPRFSMFIHFVKFVCKADRLHPCQGSQDAHPTKEIFDCGVDQKNRLKSQSAIGDAETPTLTRRKSGQFINLYLRLSQAHMVLKSNLVKTPHTTFKAVELIVPQLFIQIKCIPRTSVHYY